MRAVLFANGQLTDPASVQALLRPDDFIVCADGGTRHALALGLRPHLVVGDLDSLEPGMLAQLHDWQTAIELHPVDKDATDLELALHAARRLGADEALILGALGGRLDQQIANLLLLASPAFVGLRLSLTDGRQTAWVVRDALEVAGQPGDTVSTLALSPQVKGLTYDAGLRWPLTDATLTFSSTHGMSNELIAPTARISLKAGILLVIQERGRAGDRETCRPVDRETGKPGDR